MQVNELSQSAWKTLCDNAQVISSHAVYGPKVIRLKGGEYIKVFNKKKGLSKRKFFPKYKTFIHNSQQLKALGFNTVEIVDVYFLPHIHAYAVQYVPLKGDDFRHVFKTNPQEGVGPLMDFVVALHEKGIYFHGMHLGNVLYHENQFGIIDMADLSFHCAPLRADLRVRQLRRLFDYHQDHPCFESIGFENILTLYIAKARLSGIRKYWFKCLWRVFS